MLSVTVDGRKVRDGSTLPTGEHVLELQYFDLLEYAPRAPILMILEAMVSKDPGFPDQQECLVPWSAEADHRYVVETDIRNRAAMRCWIRDEGTNATFPGAAGIQPPTMAGAE
ncbi:MAG: hypothetical protein HY899_09695 [Deltaproteobacteria bacterium]|nr:hypothetical protein [Deltaproteobacteria bacterium]